MRNIFLGMVFSFVLGFACAVENTKPNIVFILTDDLGLTDIGCFGSTFYETPNIDKLCAHGMKFTQAYSACTVCSPTRASFLTGKYPARLHITDWIAGHVRPNAKLKVPDWTMELPLAEDNLAKRLKTAGYVSASIGKWHLGGEAFYPNKQGFDINIGGTHKGQPPSYVSPYNIPTLPDGPPGEFLSDRLTDEALKFIEKNKEKPFFLYLPHFAVHTPIDGKKEVMQKYLKKQDLKSPQHNAKYAALVESVDDSVGRIVAKLDELKLTGRTIVVFTSDNGGLLPITSNLGIRAGKGSAYEGGVRIPLIVSMPGVIKEGSTCATPVITTDFYPTFLSMTGVPDSPGHVIDGESIEPLLKQSALLKRDKIFFHYPHYHPGGATPYGAVREGDFKLVEFFETNKVELYNLKDDVMETTDLSEKDPAKAKHLTEVLHAWRESVGAQMPTPNPNYDPAKTGEKKK